MKNKKLWSILAADIIISYIVGFIVKLLLWRYWPFIGFESELFGFVVGFVFTAVVITVYYAIKNDNTNDDEDNFDNTNNKIILYEVLNNNEQ